jgi:ribonuclease-3
MADGAARIEAFVARNGLVFQDPDLLRTALTHRSYLNEHPDLDWEDNERLEFLGDAVLDFLLAEHLYLRFPLAREGELTSLRAAFVRRNTLARFAEQLGIGESLLMGHGEADTGGRERAATLCATFEALVGALYLDQGIAEVADFVMPLVEAELSGARAQVVDKDPKSHLQELAQGLLGVTPRYRTVKAEGPDHAKVFTIEVSIGDVVQGVGEGAGKQLAAQRAAADALAHQDAWAVPEVASEDARQACP